MSAKLGAYFDFKGWDFCPESGELALYYFDSQFGEFKELFSFPKVDLTRYDSIKKELESAFNCLHWMAGVSYYKTSLAQKIRMTQALPSIEQAAWLTQTWQSGLAELAHENQLPWLDHICFPSQASKVAAHSLALKPRSLVAIGGGKDSLVSIEAIKSMSESASLFMVGQSSFIVSVADLTGLPLVQIKRKVDDKLSAVNQQGAFNGHIPITAINSCVAVVTALLYDYDSVVFSNERSANVGNVLDTTGQWINHQYSKSFEFEQAWQRIIQNEIASDLSCFSLLRPFSELAIVKMFSKHKKYFPYFSSCNRNFHLTGSHNLTHHWCGQCPKCAFVYLCLAPFVSKSELVAMFHKDLLADDALNDLFESLLGLSGVKPFECVGEVTECIMAVKLLIEHPDWCDHLTLLNWFERIAEQDSLPFKQVLLPSAEHLIPNKRNFKQVLKDETG